MSRFTKELKVVPWGAWITGALLWIGFATALLIFAVPTDPDLGKWPRWGQALFAYGMMSVIIAYVALIGYVYGDAKRRGMRYVMWTLLAIFVPYLIGVIVYFILRDPLPKACPGCGNMAKSGFTFVRTAVLRCSPRVRTAAKRLSRAGRIALIAARICR